MVNDQPRTCRQRAVLPPSLSRWLRAGYNIADGDLWWGIGYLILDKTDPTKIIQRGTRMLWPTEPWEQCDKTPDTAWSAQPLSS